MLRALIPALTALLITSLPAAASAPDTSGHPLSGRLWSVAEARFLTLDALYERLPDGGWLLIGEQHDNPDHHALQTRIITALGQRGQLGAVALEMATAEQQDRFDAAIRRAQLPTPEQLDWSDGWPWPLYEAPVHAAFRWAPRVLGADLTRAQLQAVYADRAPGGELEPAHADFMRDLLFESHCGQLPRKRLEPMRQVQLARDQRMASVLRNHRTPARTGVLLTGSIHARRDLGVPRWLDDTPHLTLLLVAVQPGQTSPQHYLPATFGNLPTTDLILFTPHRDAPDYCSEFAH